LQTGQRIGSAVGIAVTGRVFYNQLASSRGDSASAFRHGIVNIAVPSPPRSRSWWRTRSRSDS
jgi:hypothetical protein